MKNDRSHDLFTRAKDLIPGGVNSPVRAFRAVGGTPVFFEVDGQRVPSMARAYTEDDGHLNAAGQRVAGAAAIRMLADTLARRGGMAAATAR